MLVSSKLLKKRKIKRTSRRMRNQKLGRVNNIRTSDIDPEM
jgi:hypothetical protein